MNCSNSRAEIVPPAAADWNSSSESAEASWIIKKLLVAAVSLLTFSLQSLISVTAADQLACRLQGVAASSAYCDYCEVLLSFKCIISMIEYAFKDYNRLNITEVSPLCCLADLSHSSLRTFRTCWQSRF